MLRVAPGVKVYLACQPVDMRRGFDGLSADVARVLAADPYSGAAFVFRGKRGDYVKILTWDGSGLCLFAKRLDHIGFDRRDLDLVVFADQVLLGVRRKSFAALLANARHVVEKFVGIVRKPPVVRLMSSLRPARTRILALLLLVRRRRLGRRARILVRPLQTQHQLDQLLFAQLLQITAVHAAMDSDIAPPRKGVGNCRGGMR